MKDRLVQFGVRQEPLQPSTLLLEILQDDRFRAAGVGGCRKGDVVIGIGEDYRDRSAQFASVSPPA